MTVILPLIAILTSIISGVAGMAGGVLLLSLMSFVLPYQALIPIHGLVQFISNSSRSFYLRRHLRKDFIIPFLLGTPIGFILVYHLLKNIEGPEVFYLLLSVFIIYTVFKPKRLPELRLNKYGWLILGSLACIQSALLGATGPLLAIFYVRSDLTKEEVVSNKAFQQLFTHFLKIPLFLSLNFDYLKYSAVIILMSLGAIIGTYIGVNTLKKINHTHFNYIFKSLLLIAAARLAYKFAIAL